MILGFKFGIGFLLALFVVWLVWQVIAHLFLLVRNLTEAKRTGQEKK